MRAQGSLEYLIIIAMVIAIIAIVASFVVNYFSTQTGQYYYASCSSAAATCKITLVVDPSNPCTVCDNACNYTDGAEIFANAITCCKQGKSEEIYSGSLGCAAAICGNNVRDIGEECDGTDTGVCADGCNADCTCICPACGCYKCIDGACAPICADGCLSCPDGVCRVTCAPSGTLSFKETNITDQVDNFGVTGLVVGNVDSQPATGNKIAVSGYDNPTVKMYRNASGGWPMTPIASSTGLIRGLALGDINQDGTIELVTAAQRTMSYYYASGVWKECLGFQLTNSPLSIAIGDITNYSLPDLGNYIDNTNEPVYGITGGPIVFTKLLFIGCGGGVVDQKTISGSEYGNPFAIAVGDADNDHGLYSEIAATWSTYGTDGNRVKIIKNETGRWTVTPVALNLPGEIHGIAIGDADNDGLNEVVVGMSACPYELRMYKNESGTWNEYQIWDEPAGVGITSLTIGKVTSGSDNEIITGLSNGAVRIYRNNLLTHTWTEIKVVDGLPAPVTSISVGDANNDNKNEIVIGMFLLSPSPKNATRMYSYTYS